MKSRSDYIPMTPDLTTAAWRTCDLMMALTPAQRRVLAEMVPTNQPSRYIGTKAGCAEQVVKDIRRERHRLSKSASDERRAARLDAERTIANDLPWPDRDGDDAMFVARLRATYGPSMPA